MVLHPYHGFFLNTGTEGFTPTSSLFHFCLLLFLMNFLRQTRLNITTPTLKWKSIRGLFLPIPEYPTLHSSMNGCRKWGMQISQQFVVGTRNLDILVQRSLDKTKLSIQIEETNLKSNRKWCSGGIFVGEGGRSVILHGKSRRGSRGRREECVESSSRRINARRRVKDMWSWIMKRR